MTKIKKNKAISLGKSKQKVKINKLKNNKVVLKKNQSKEPSENNFTEAIETEDTKNNILVSKTQIRNSVSTLLTVLQKQNENKSKELLENDSPIILQIRAIKVPKCPRRLVRFVLPHSLVPETGDVCLFVSDLKKGRKIDHEPTIHFYEDLLREKGITNIRGIIPMRQVKVEYDQYELKRRLLNQYDVFLADAKISGHLTHLLGKTFAVKRKHVTPVRLNPDKLKEQIDRGLRKVALRIHSQGDISTVTIGHNLQKINEITENIEAVVKNLEKLYPGGWKNIRSLYIKTHESVAVPIYVTLKPNSSVEAPKMKPIRPKKSKTVKGELSTFANANVSVTPSGKVKIRTQKINKKIEDDNIKEIDEPTESNKRPIDQPTKTIKKKKTSKKEDSDSDDDSLIENAEKDYLFELSRSANSKKTKKIKMQD